MGAGVKECGGGVELVGRKGGLGGARAGGGLSSPDSVRAGLAVGGGQTMFSGRGSLPAIKTESVEGGALSFGCGEWRGRG